MRRGEGFNPNNPDNMINKKSAEKAVSHHEDDTKKIEAEREAFDNRMNDLAKELEIDKDYLVRAYALEEYNSREKYKDESTDVYETSQRTEGELTDKLKGRDALKKQIEETLEARKASEEDVLMGIPNRRALEEMVTKLYGKIEESKKEIEVEENRRNKETKEVNQHEFSMIMIDIDKFKNVNDTYGHPGGDYVLNKVGQTLKNNMREGDFIARYGGEEIVVIAPNANGSVTEFAERLRKEIENTEFNYKGQDIKITMSAGVSTFEEDFTTMKQSSDDGLYAAKEGGRNQVRYLDTNTGEYVKHATEETQDK